MLGFSGALSEAISNLLPYWGVNITGLKDLLGFSGALFLKYKTEPLNMIESLKLVDMEVMDLATMKSIFTKLNADPRLAK